jgi:hypothetical protein
MSLRHYQDSRAGRCGFLHLGFGWRPVASGLKPQAGPDLLCGRAVLPGHGCTACRFPSPTKRAGLGEDKGGGGGGGRKET